MTTSCNPVCKQGLLFNFQTATSADLSNLHRHLHPRVHAHAGAMEIARATFAAWRSLGESRMRANQYCLRRSFCERLTVLTFVYFFCSGRSVRHSPKLYKNAAHVVPQQVNALRGAMPASVLWIIPFSFSTKALGFVFLKCSFSKPHKENEIFASSRKWKELCDGYSKLNAIVPPRFPRHLYKKGKEFLN